jgi:hypothetical protein
MDGHVTTSALAGIALVSLGIAMTAPALAQTPMQNGKTTWLIEAVAAGYRTDHPEGGPGGLGLAVALERRLAPRHSIRFTLSTLQTVVTADDIALCHPLPGGGCVPDSVFPGVLWIAEVSYLLQPLIQLPLLMLTGAGVVLPRGHPEGHGAFGNPNAAADPGASWRIGLEARLGNSLRAPRLQVAATALAHRMMSLEGLVTVALQLRLR